MFVTRSPLALTPAERGRVRRADARIESALQTLEVVLAEDRSGWTATQTADRVRALGLLGDLVHRATLAAVADADAARCWADEGALHPVPWLVQQLPVTSVDAARLLRAARTARAQAAGAAARVQARPGLRTPHEAPSRLSA